MASCSMTFALYLTIALESTDFNTTQTWVAIFKTMSYVCSADIYFLWALDAQKKKNKKMENFGYF